MSGEDLPSSESRKGLCARNDVPTLPKAGRYELLDELGRGAMGVVYRAHDPVIGRSVAVKTMRLSEEGTGMTHAELIARFQTEARAAGLLSHPNIVVVYDAGEEEGLFYITMECVEGRSLQALVDAGQSFPLPRMLRLMEQACSALEFAHQRNVIHRDIKPANLMLTPDDTLKITDFGTAKILQFGTAQTAHIMGTPSYMSPEQVKGKLVDGRSDIFSLGVILYELVTGEKPFPGQNITTVIYKIINEDPIPPRELDSSVHPGLSAVITRALAKEPSARYATCRELMEALRNYREVGEDASATVMVGPRSAASGGPRPGALPLHTAGVAKPEPQKKRGGIWLALALVTIIAGAAYRVGPYVRDAWELSRATLAERRSGTARQAQSPALPAEGHPEAQAPPQGQPAAPNAAPAEEAVPHDERLPEGKPAEARPVAKTPPSRPAERAQEPPAKSPSAELKSRIERSLADAGLSGKVSVKVASNTFTLSGRLAPREHRQLLQMLRNAPTWARIVDHIEYAGPGSGESAVADRAQPATGRGEIGLLTDVLGAAAMLRGPQGRVVADCRTPCQFKNLWPGRYTLEVKQAGYQPVQRNLQVRAGGVVDERIELQPVFSGLYVTSQPPQARVFINGQPQPDPTPTTVRLDPGTYNIAVRKAGFDAYAGQVQVKANEPTQLDVELAQRLGGNRVDANTGSPAKGITVITTPPGAEILVDGFSIRERTPAQLNLAPGEHTLTLSLKGHTVARRTIMVEANQAQQVSVTLH